MIDPLARNFCFCLLLLVPFLPLRAERPDGIREQLSYIASALSSANPSDALSPVDKSCPNYDKLRDYFIGLTQAYDVTTEITIKDEDDREADTKLIVDWRLTLADRATNMSSQRNADVNLIFVQRDGKWKIVDLSPIDFFNPQRARP